MYVAAAARYWWDDIQRAHLVEWEFDARAPNGMEHAIFRVKVYHEVGTELLSLTV